MPSTSTILKEIARAEQIRPYIRETPLDFSPFLSQQSGCDVYLKLENLQYTGSFKLRGAMNKLLSLTPAQRSKGVVAASSGNHGAAVAFGMKKLGVPGTIFVPEDASQIKVDAIRCQGVTVKFYGSDCVIAEHYARRFAEENGMVYISPYNDLQVIAGQGTIAVELARQLDKIDTIFVALGGGGMISGIAIYLKSLFNDVQIIACSPRNSAVMVESINAGRILEMESLPTLSDGTAGGVEPGAITFDLCRRYVDDYIMVTEDEIKIAMCQFIETHHQLIEGAAGVAIAAFLKEKEKFKGKNVVIVICGANISLQTLKSIL